jgi:hypothetical protein
MPILYDDDDDGDDNNVLMRLYLLSTIFVSLPPLFIPHSFFSSREPVYRQYSNLISVLSE